MARVTIPLNDPWRCMASPFTFVVQRRTLIGRPVSARLILPERAEMIEQPAHVVVAQLRSRDGRHLAQAFTNDGQHFVRAPAHRHEGWCKPAAAVGAMTGLA